MGNDNLDGFEILIPFGRQKLPKHLGGGVVNINTLTASEADELIKKGWGYLKRKPKSKSKSKAKDD